MTGENVISTILDWDSDDVVVVAMAEWSEARAMMTPDQKVKFRQAREVEGDWLLVDFIQPELPEWGDVERLAFEMNLEVPTVCWSGPVNNIPAGLLMCDELIVRKIDKPGWRSLKAYTQKLSRGFSA